MVTGSSHWTSTRDLGGNAFWNSMRMSCCVGDESITPASAAFPAGSTSVTTDGTSPAGADSTEKRGTDEMRSGRCRRPRVGTGVGCSRSASRTIDGAGAGGMITVGAGAHVAGAAGAVARGAEAEVAERVDTVVAGVRRRRAQRTIAQARRARSSRGYLASPLAFETPCSSKPTVRAPPDGTARGSAPRSASRCSMMLGVP